MIYFLRLIFHIFLVKMTYSSEPFGNCSARHLLKDGLFFFPNDTMQNIYAKWTPYLISSWKYWACIQIKINFIFLLYILMSNCNVNNFLL